ncbi:MAG: DUF4352 domain-containing protein [Segniliparus sp.]|uniref:DUF4352 domain-containing protein n=1 Tax=Segniliparus sp. TaxID=2804064 RepID=UPI003F3173FA
MTYDPHQPPAGHYPLGGVHVHLPEKRPRKWPWITACVALVLCCGPCSYILYRSGSHDGTGGSAGHEAAQTAALGSPVRDGKFEFTVTEISPGSATIGSNPRASKKPQGKFVVVTVTVSNTGDKPEWFNPLDQKLIDHDGKTFKADTAFKTEPGDWNGLMGDNINPGNTVTVKIAYDIPQNTEPQLIELHDSRFSHGVKAALS